MVGLRLDMDHQPPADDDSVEQHMGADDLQFTAAKLEGRCMLHENQTNPTIVDFKLDTWIKFAVHFFSLFFNNSIFKQLVHCCFKNVRNNFQTSKQCQLQELRLQSDFLPFFLNYLRDSTNHLVCSVNSSMNTPAKTPTSAQKLRQSVKNSQNCQKRRGNRINLFNPNVSSQNENSFQQSTPENNYSPSNLSCHTPTSTRSNQSWTSRDRSRREDQSWRNTITTPGSITPIKSESALMPHSLNTSDSIGRRKKKSPSIVDLEHQDSHRPSSQTGSRRRSGGRKSGGNNRKPRNFVESFDTPTSFKLDSEDFPSIETAKSLKPRRITPTRVTKDSARKVNNVLFTMPSNKFGGSDDVGGNEPFRKTITRPSNSLKEERELLRQEKLKRRDSLPQEDVTTSPVRIVPKTPTKPPFGFKSTSSDRVIAQLNLVTHTDKLDVLAELYSRFLQECLIPNLPVEIYFLVQLLTSYGRSPDDEVTTLPTSDIEDVNYLSTVHNCVYFAVKVLEGQSSMLSLLDETTVKLLSESTIVSEFSTTFSDHFLLDFKTSAVPTLLPMFTSPVNAVHFSADTDNRQNFPSNQSFHDFKKQRDQFYEVLREWEDNHRLPGWNMMEMQASKIRSVIRQASNPINYIHFARLFRSQLITMCQGDSSFLTGSDTEDQHLLSQLKKSNPEKFKRLQERFFTPSRSAGPCPPPSFNGCQEFFRNFIVSAESYILNQHLIDSFSAKITELNDASIILADNQDQLLKEEQREHFKLSLKVLCLLSKFLGFVLFLPYRGNNASFVNVSDDVIALRNKCQPPLDLCGYVKASFVDRRLVFTIPWIVEFLSMMDSTSPHLQYYQNLLILLVDIYRFSSSQFSADISTSWLFLICIMGWLFELPIFPPALFFNAFSNNHESSLPILKQTSKGCVFLDNLNIVDQKLLYNCCPYLAEIKTLLTGTVNGTVAKSTPMKKITPVSANPLPKPVITEKPIQVQLEDNFFDNHSQSLKKTVEFVSKRISSNCIKSIDANLMPEHLSTATNALKAVKSDHDSEAQAKVDVEVWLKGKMSEIETQESKATQEKAVLYSHRFIEEHSSIALLTLLPTDTNQDVLTVVTKITIRHATARVRKWITTQIPGAFQTEMSSTLSKIVKLQNKETQKHKLVIIPAKWHDPTAYSPSEAIDSLKKLICKLTDKVPVTFEEVQNEVTSVKKTLTTRQDMTSVAFQTIYCLLAELTSVLLVSCPDYLTSIVHFEKIINNVKADNRSSDLGKTNFKGSELIISDDFKYLKLQELAKTLENPGFGKNIAMQNEPKNKDEQSVSINLISSERAIRKDDLNDIKTVKTNPTYIEQCTLLDFMIGFWKGECPVSFPVGVIECNRMDVLIKRSKKREKCQKVRQDLLDKVFKDQK